MLHWGSVGEIPPDFGRTAVTIGNFDGVHRGHRAVLERMVCRAHAAGLKAVAITFDPHPLQLLHPERAPELLTAMPWRLELLARTGLDATLVLPFTMDLAHQSPQRFAREFLVDALHAAVVVVGEDFRFGWRNTGDITTLRRLGVEYGFGVITVEEVTANVPELGQDAPGEAEPRRWSSSWARELLAAGDVTDAMTVLGRPHRVGGTVVHGDARGRELGFPTANLGEDATGFVPADGVYAGWVTQQHRGEAWPAAISVGSNPTFAGNRRRIEAYVLDRTDLDLYGEWIDVDFTRRLRPTLRFASVGELIAQMRTDVAECRAVLTPPIRFPGTTSAEKESGRA